METFSTASLSSTCATISNRALSASVELDEMAKQLDAGDLAISHLTNLSTKLQELSKGSETLGQQLNNAIIISQSLQRTLSQWLTTSGYAAAVIERHVKALPPDAKDRQVDNPMVLSDYDCWATLASRAVLLLQQLLQM
jgi:hypothetical protein